MVPPGMTWWSWVWRDPIRRAISGPGGLRYRVANAVAEVIQRRSGGAPGVVGRWLFGLAVAIREWRW